MGSIYSIIAGALMSVQGVFNTRTSEKIGLWETNTIVQGTGFILTIILLLLFGKGNFTKFGSVNKIYYLGGIIGVFIIFTVMKGVSEIGPASANMLILISQLILAYLIEAFGLFGTKQIGFEWTKLLGVFLMIAGIAIFRWHTS